MPNLHDLVNPRGSTGRGSHPSLWRGLVVNITANSVWVRVPTLAQDDIAATNTLPGDRVIIGAVEGRVDNLIVLAKEEPTVPNHTHPQTDISYPGWAPLTLAAPWTPGTDPDIYPGLRYRADSRFVYVNGQITGGPGTITTLPVAPLYEGRITASTTSGGSAVLRLQKTGAISSTNANTYLINGYAPLT